jgi:hypothetical protein
MAIVLSAHGAMGWILLRAAASGNSKPESHARPSIRLVTLAAGADPAPVLPPASSDGRKDVAATRAAPVAAPHPDTPSPSLRSARPIEAFLSPAELDLAARPRSAPDTTLLEGLQWSGVPMRLRIFVDAAGTVVDVIVLQSADADDVVQSVRRMFLATGFIAARVNGLDVPSYKDVEIAIGDGRAHDPQQRAGNPGQSAATAVE